MSLAFALRNRIRWPGLPFDDSPRLSSDFHPPTLRGRELLARYGLETVLPKLSRISLDETLGVLDCLDRIPADLWRRPGAPFRVLDIGAKSWRYLPALKTWLGRLFPDIPLQVDGCEIDAFRLYASLRTNLSRARYFSTICATDCFDPTYHPIDAAEYRRKARLVTWFFPFVLPEQHVAWGLPRSRFDAAGLFSSVIERIVEGEGRLIVANQGEWERDATESLMKGCRKDFSCEITGSLHPSPYPIFLSVWTREE